MEREGEEGCKVRCGGEEWEWGDAGWGRDGCEYAYGDWGREGWWGDEAVDWSGSEGGQAQR